MPRNTWHFITCSSVKIITTTNNNKPPTTTKRARKTAGKPLQHW